MGLPPLPFDLFRHQFSKFSNPLKLTFALSTLVRQSNPASILNDMATRCQFENSNEVGVFAALTNAYCLTGKT